MIVSKKFLPYKSWSALCVLTAFAQTPTPTMATEPVGGVPGKTFSCPSPPLNDGVAHCFSNYCIDLKFDNFYNIAPLDHAGIKTSSDLMKKIEDSPDEAHLYFPEVCQEYAKTLISSADPDVGIPPLQEWAKMYIHGELFAKSSEEVDFLKIPYYARLHIDKHEETNESNHQSYTSNHLQAEESFSNPRSDFFPYKIAAMKLRKPIESFFPNVNRNDNPFRHKHSVLKDLKPSTIELSIGHTGTGIGGKIVPSGYPDYIHISGKIKLPLGTQDSEFTFDGNLEAKDIYNFLLSEDSNINLSKRPIELIIDNQHANSHVNGYEYLKVKKITITSISQNKFTQSELDQDVNTTLNPDQ